MAYSPFYFLSDNHGKPKNPVRHLSIDNHVAPLFQVFRPPYLGIDPYSRCCRDSFDIIEREFNAGIEINAAEIRRFDEMVIMNKHKTALTMVQPG